MPAAKVLCKACNTDMWMKIPDNLKPSGWCSNCQADLTKNGFVMQINLATLKRKPRR